MSAILNYMQLCRLCLVKDGVTVPIFGEANDVRQIFLKITACLPVKVSQDDNLPKKICDQCLYKVDLLYQFWNTTVNAEKQLIQWFSALGVDVNLKSTEPPPLRLIPLSHSNMHPETIILKEERPDPDLNEEPFRHQIVQPAVPMKRPRGRPPKHKLQPQLLPLPQLQPQPQPLISTAVTTRERNQRSERRDRERRERRERRATRVSRSMQELESTDESGTDDRGMAPGDSEKEEDEQEGEKRVVTKIEIDSGDERSSPEPTAFVEVPSDQAGPSGLTTTPKSPTPITEPGCELRVQNNNIFPFNVWDSHQKIPYEKVTIKVEPIDINWDDEEMTLLDLRAKMGLHTIDSNIPLDTPTQKSDSTNRKLESRKRRYRPTSRPAPRGTSSKTSCVICQKILRGRSTILSHYSAHKDQKLQENLALIHKFGEEDFFRCPTCLKEFVSRDLLQGHQDYHTERPYFCVKCLKSFKQLQNFLSHMEFHRESTLMKCIHCEFSTTFKLAFDKHVRTHSKEEFRCEECGKCFPVRTWFEEHKNYHTGEKPFSCEECGKCFPYTRYLTAHKKSMHPHCFFKEPELNQCHICHKRYSHKNSLRLHLKSHSGDNLYICEICGKQLSSSDKLQLHKRIHTGYKPYECTICQKRFTKKDILTDHLRVHSGEKPFACETCGKCFSQRSPLTIHRRYHTGERPYVCHLCNKGFVSKGILGIHLKQGKH